MSPFLFCVLRYCKIVRMQLQYAEVSFLGLLKDKAVIRRKNLLLALKGMIQRHVSYIRMLPPYLI